MKKITLAALALALLPFLGRTDDDSSGNGFDRAIRRNHGILMNRDAKRDLATLAPKELAATLCEP